LTSPETPPHTPTKLFSTSIRTHNVWSKSIDGQLISRSANIRI
jgi:hypothetical protein